MKILHVEAGRFLYGGARQVLYIMEGLQQLGISNVLACPPDSDIAQAARHVAQVHEIPMKGDVDIGLVRRLKNVIRQTHPDLVHLHSRRGADVWGGVAALKMQVPSVLSRRVDNPENAWWAQCKYRLYDHVIAISEGIRQVLLSEGIEAEHVTCVRSAVDAAPYLHTVERDAFAKEFGIPQDSLVIGVVAQLIERKGHRYLLEAMPAILARFPNVQVLFFGKGPLHDELLQLIEQQGLTAQVHLAGFRTDLPQWLGGLDLLVHPADMEGLGVSLLQAAAAAVPVIASAAGGLPEAVADKKTGILIPPGDIPALTAAIIELLANPALRHQYGQAGRARVLAEFSVSAMVQGNLNVYRKILNRG